MLLPAATSPTTGGTSPTKTREQIRIDEKEASRFKSKGNAAIAARDFDGAIAACTAALELSPDGASSHVFNSNRAAALCYLEQFKEAEVDSETSIRLRPDYGKGWARLGLSTTTAPPFPHVKKLSSTSRTIRLVGATSKRP